MMIEPTIKGNALMRKLSPNEKLIGVEGLTVADFWAWAYSDLLVNTNRSVFAEYLVACALGVTDILRLEWDAVDIRYRGKKIEVKASSYLQSWKQKALSTINFDIGIKKVAWDAATNTYASSEIRQADCYVFCLYAEQNASNVNVLDVAHWRFYVIATSQLNDVFGEQRSVRLSRLLPLCDAVMFDDLREKIEQVLKL